MLNQEGIVSFMAVWSERRKWRMMARAEGVGLVRCRHLTHHFCFWKTEIKYSNTMAETSLWVFLQQSLILAEEQLFLCQKLIITLYDRKTHFIVRYLKVPLREYLDSIIYTLALVKSRNYFSA